MDERTRRIKSPNVCPKTRMCSDEVKTSQTKRGRGRTSRLDGMGVLQFQKVGDQRGGLN